MNNKEKWFVKFINNKNIVIYIFVGLIIFLFVIGGYEEYRKPTRDSCVEGFKVPKGEFFLEEDKDGFIGVRYSGGGTYTMERNFCDIKKIKLVVDENISQALSIYKEVRNEKS